MDKSYHFAKAEVINLRQVIELNLYKNPIAGIYPAVFLPKFNCKKFHV
ncbi:hypothetical protein [Campylobacter concisus]|nr:hypothetical protein [Campylobacter concisus]